jgi:ribonuclease BN (tRNA processing enzyme)
LQSPTGTIALATDTRPLPELDHPLWQSLDWLFLECSFPDEQQPLAEASKHLTVSEFLAWIQKLPTRTRVVPIHLKPRHAAAVLAALGKIQHPAIQLPPLHGGEEPWTVHVSRNSV